MYMLYVYISLYMYISWYIYIHIFHYIYENKSIYTYIITIIAIVDHIFLQMFRMFQLKTTKTLQRYNMMYTNTIYIYIYTNHVLSDCRMLTNCDFISSHSLRPIVLCIFRGFLASHLGLFRSHDPYITAPDKFLGWHGIDKWCIILTVLGYNKSTYQLSFPYLRSIKISQHFCKGFFSP